MNALFLREETLRCCIMSLNLPYRVVRSLFCLITLFVLTFASPMATAGADSTNTAENAPAPGERALIGRLVAPCCWQQTLDVHTGPMADALRAEVRARLWAGETADAIAADFAVRYGPRVNAVPQGNPIAGVSLALAVLSLFAAGGLFFVVRRWRRAGQTHAPPLASATTRDAYDERIDDELRAM